MKTIWVAVVWLGVFCSALPITWYEIYVAKDFSPKVGPWFTFRDAVVGHFLWLVFGTVLLFLTAYGLKRVRVLHNRREAMVLGALSFAVSWLLQEGFRSAPSVFFPKSISLQLLVQFSAQVAAFVAVFLVVVKRPDQLVRERKRT